MKNFIILFTLLFFVSCTTMPGLPGYISYSTSKFDGTKAISMEPAWLYDSKVGTKFSLYKNTKMAQDAIILTVTVAELQSFSKGYSLHFNIDGSIMSFESIDQLTDYKTTTGYAGSGLYFPPRNWSFKRYAITMDFLKQIIDANRVVVKVDLGPKYYTEGVFSTDHLTTARPAFKAFHQKLASFK